MARVGTRDVERVRNSMSPGVLAEIHAEERKRREQVARKEREINGPDTDDPESLGPLFGNPEWILVKTTRTENLDSAVKTLINNEQVAPPR